MRRCRQMMCALMYVALFVTLGGAAAFAIEPLPHDRIEKICDTILADAKEHHELVDSTPEIVVRRTNGLIKKIEDYHYFDFDLSEDLSDFAATAFLQEVQTEFKRYIAFVRDHPDSFDAEFKDRLFKHYYTVLLELQLRREGRSLRFSSLHYFGNRVEGNGENEEIASRYEKLVEGVQNSMGGWDEPKWSQFRYHLQNANLRPGFAPFRPDLDRVEQVVNDVPFADAVGPVTVTDQRSAVVEEAVDGYFLSDQFVVNFDLQKAFPMLIPKIERAQAHILSNKGLSTRQQKSLQSYLYNMIVAYELLYYSYYVPELKAEVGEPLINIMAAMVIGFFSDLRDDLPYEIVDQMKTFIFYNHPQINTDLILKLEEALEKAFGSEAAPSLIHWYVDYLSESLMR